MRWAFRGGDRHYSRLLGGFMGKMADSALRARVVKHDPGSRPENGCAPAQTSIAHLAAHLYWRCVSATLPSHVRHCLYFHRRVVLEKDSTVIAADAQMMRVRDHV